MQVDWGKVSRITDFCLSRLSTQGVINAKAEAIRESSKGWFEVYEERNLADPECHYEAVLCKYAARYHYAALDSVASEHEKLIRSTPSCIFGKLSFVQQMGFQTFMVQYNPKPLGSILIGFTHDQRLVVGIPIEGTFMNVYTLEVEVW